MVKKINKQKREIEKSELVCTKYTKNMQNLQKKEHMRQTYKNYIGEQKTKPIAKQS